MPITCLDGSTLDFSVETSKSGERVSFTPRNLVIVGWAGRDEDSVQAHIRELQALGVKPPRKTPLFYKIAPSLLTTAAVIRVVGETSSGEAEAVILRSEDRMWVGIGSDHTDRKLETVGVTISKQVCAKPIGATLWRFEDVEPHWDKLELRSYVHVGGARRPYQQGSVSTLHAPSDLIARYRHEGGAFESGSAMFCGTVPVHGEFQYAGEVELELHDPVLGRSLNHRYRVDMLPIQD